MIVYLHGFLSSPASGKVRLLAERLAQRGLSDALWCGQLPVAPREAIATVEQALAQAKTPPTLVGSSLGGYYATYLAERHGLPAALINPAVEAPRTLAGAVGIQRNYHTGEACEFTTEHLAQLRELDVAQPTRQGRYWLLVETSDEVLDYRRAVERFPDARQTVIDGGDHGFAHFADFLDAIIDFALKSSPGGAGR